MKIGRKKKRNKKGIGKNWENMGDRTVYLYNFLGNTPVQEFARDSELCDYGRTYKKEIEKCSEGGR